MNDGKPNILGKLPVYNDAGEIFDAGADKVQSKHKITRKGHYGTSDKVAKHESKERPKKKVVKKEASRGSDPAIPKRSRPAYSVSKKPATKKGYGSDKGKGGGKAPPPISGKVKRV